jgi:protein tyrosine phosphatase (PTP) superfamily phosphohydrolase (DUF442 family)
MFLLDRLYNFYWVTKDAARSAQPYLGFYATFLKSHGIKSIINLRGENPKHGWWHAERARAERLGILHFDVRLDTRKLPAQDRIRQLFNAFANARMPILFKCSGGQDRTSLAAAFLLLDQGGAAALPAAKAQFARWPYLHRPAETQMWMQQFPVFAVEDAAGAPLREWARRYDPEHFAEWLKARGMGASYEVIQTPWPVTPPTAL